MMMHAFAPSPLSVAFGMLHGIGALLFTVGIVLLLVWAIKALHVAQLKRWGIGFVVAALVLLALSAAGGVAMWKGGMGGDGMMGMPGMRMKMEMGTMDNRERTIAVTALPMAVQEAIKTKYPMGMMMEAMQTSAEDGTTYDVELKMGEKMMGVVYGEDGTFIQEEDYSGDRECGMGSGSGMATSCTMMKGGMMKNGMMGHDMMMEDEDDSHDMEMDPMDMSMQDMSEMLAGKTGDDFDKAFLVGMIPHHQGAIDMANAALKSAKHDEVKALAKAIIESQQKEIDQMKSWLKTWGYEK